MATKLYCRVLAGPHVSMRPAAILFQGRFLSYTFAARYRALPRRRMQQQRIILDGCCRRDFCNQGSSCSYEEALGGFRRRASAEVAAVADGLGSDSVRLTAELRTALETELGPAFAETAFEEAASIAAAFQAEEEEGDASANASSSSSGSTAQPEGTGNTGSSPADPAAAAAAELGQELGQALARVAAVSELSQERKELRTRRADLLTVGYQDQVGENMEYAALAICAIAGIFAVSIHYAFFVAWGASYYVYRRATRKLRAKHDATAELQDTLERLRIVDEELSEYRADLHSLAVAWKSGNPSAEAGVKFE